MYTISVGFQKGGVGKTSLTLALSAYLKNLGKKVLVVDLDSQGNTTSTLRGSKEGATIADVLAGDIPAKEAIIPANVDLIAGNMKLNTGNPIAEGDFTALKKALAPLQKKYDYCVIDVGPAMGLLMTNALTASDGVLIPLQADIYSIDDLGLFAQTINGVKANLNKKLSALGIVINAYESRGVLNQQALELIQKEAKAHKLRVFSPIRKAIVVREAQALREADIFSYAPSNSKVLQDYKTVFTELMEVIG